MASTAAMIGATLMMKLAAPARDGQLANIEEHV
jgi:hypothetical protein